MVIILFFLINGLAFIHLYFCEHSSIDKADTVALLLLLHCTVFLSVNGLFYGYIILHITLCSCLQLCRYNSREGEKKRKEAFLLHHNHYRPLCMGRSNFIIAPAGTVKSKLMNTECFLLRRVVSLVWWNF